MGAILCWLACCGLIGHLLARASGAVRPRAGQALIGGAALALQLWLYGALGVPWHRSALAAPWLVLALVLRQRLWPCGTRLARLWPGLLLLAVVGIAFLCALMDRPWVGYDALAFWGFKARSFWHSQAIDLRFLLGDQPDIRLMRQLDYPPLMPLLMDSVCVVAGRYDESLAKAVQLLCFLSGGMALYRSAQRHLPGWSALLVLAGFVALPSTHSFLLTAEHMGYADYLFAVLMLCALCELLAARAPWALALGAAAALVKQEGLPLLCAVAGLGLLRRPGRGHWLLACALALVPFALWRAQLLQAGIGSDLLTRTAPAGSDVAQSLAVIGRYVTALLRVQPEHWLPIANLAAALGLMLWAPAARPRRRGLLLLCVPGLHALLTLVVWVFSPYGTEAHVQTSLVRVASQFAPMSWVFLVAAGRALRVRRAAPVG